MIDNLLLIAAFILGILLCFCGFKLFRASMAIAGFFMGIQAGNILNAAVLLEKIPSGWQEIWSTAFPIGLGILLGVLSYAIYKKALFFVSMFFTWYTIMKVFVLYIVKTQANLNLFITFSPNTVAKLTEASEASQSLITDKQISFLMSYIPGNNEWEKFLAVCLIAILIGILVGILICILQEPAIKVITAVIGADIIRDAFVTTAGLLYSWEKLPSFLDPVVKQGVDNVWVSFFVWAAMIGAGIAIQIRSSHN
ncbi:MAG: DUF4203 domain-containing protein [Clostridiales bacterium]|nr:DUF4203 domain-containing protein [Clostridiales bacterium]